MSLHCCRKGKQHGALLEAERALLLLLLEFPDLEWGPQASD